MRRELSSSSGARLKLEAGGRKNYVAADPVLDIELMKPFAAKGDFLLAGFERVSGPDEETALLSI